MPYTVNSKVYTDHALMDEIVHNCKIILEGIVLKDSERADEYETENSLVDSEILLSINDGDIDFDFFPFTKQLLIDFGYSPYKASVYMADRSQIPSEDREDLMTYCCNRFVDEYDEENNYYRMLNGKPDFGTSEYDIYIKYEDYQTKFDRVMLSFDFSSDSVEVVSFFSLLLLFFLFIWSIFSLRDSSIALFKDLFEPFLSNK